jgi:hypothetical protein
MARANGSAGSARTKFRAREENEAWQTKRFPEISDGYDYRPISNVAIVLPEKTDHEWIVDQVSDNNTVVSAEFEFIDIDN